MAATTERTREGWAPPEWRARPARDLMPIQYAAREREREQSEES